MTATEAPDTRDRLAALLAELTAARGTARIRGGGTSSRRGLPVPEPPVVISTRALDRVIAHEPADLTVTVEAGMAAEELHRLLAARGQAWPQADRRPGATVGGLLATAAGGDGRLRAGPIRDSVLEVVLCTGDGRLVKAGGRTVKGVAGYDLCRLAVGSLGTLGVIVEVTLKLWPVPLAEAWFAAEGPPEQLVGLADTVRREVHRPAALLLTPTRLLLWRVGPEADVVAPAGFVPVSAPGRPAWPGTVEAGVPPAALTDLSARLAAEGRDHVAQLGVGICRVEVREPDDVAAVRAAAIAAGGHAQVVDGAPALRTDPWGPPPPGLAIMRRLRRAFDPGLVLNPGMFVGDAAPAAAPGVPSRA